MIKKALITLYVLAFFLHPMETRAASAKCEKSVTTAHGTRAPNEKMCSGDLIFEETFETLDLDVWEHLNKFADKDNSEFQWYTNNRSNSFTEDGILNIHPTLTAEDFGEPFLYAGRINLKDECTSKYHESCAQSGSQDEILDPVKSAHIQSSKSFSFKYGKVEISAKMPSGDWLLPSISLLPKSNAYGSWPASGKIDLAQSRGNRELFRNKTNIGVEQIESALQFGPYPDLKTVMKFERASKEKGFNAGFHRYQMEWTENKITFSVDDIETGTLKAGKQGFWEKGGFEARAPGTSNPWVNKMSPFDQNFYFVINLAVGGKSFADDDSVQPWKKDSLNPKTEFWQAKNLWLPTWKNEENKTDTSFLIDYIRVWAL